MHIGHAIGLVFCTVFVHAGCTVLVLAWLERLSVSHWAVRSHLGRGSVLAGLVFLMSLAAFVESALWAGVYAWVDALPTFDDALYFSMVTFTTLGYGDVTLDEEWRMLGAFQAANGILLFGWTTALIVNVAQRLFRRTESGARDG